MILDVLLLLVWVLIVVGASALMGCLLAWAESQWPDITDDAGRRVWGRDVWRD